MAEAKPFASLSSGLLARKGAAKPAMRPQGFGQMGMGLEDLGWNDMGEPHPVELETAEPESAPAPQAAEEPVVVAFAAPEESIAQPMTTGVPEVVRQQDALADHIAEPPPLIPLAAHRYVRAAPAPEPRERRSAQADGRRAAFTLRVDEARHLKLRLACTMQGRSAQQIVTEALDRLLNDLPELDDLARRVKRR